MDHIPRQIVATALDLAPDDLPPGDLPVARLAEYWHRDLVLMAADREVPAHWASDLILTLPEHAPEPAWATIRATLDLCTTPEEVAVLAAGPTEDLIGHHGAAMIDRIAADAAASARVRYLLSGVWQAETPALLWARIEAARAGGPALDDGDPLPPV